MSAKNNSGSIMGGSILILLGLLILFGQWFQSFDFLGALWPLFIVGFGALFFVGMLAGGKSAAGLAIPGSIITVIGLMLLAQSLTGYWESWSYAWTVILISVGLGIFIMGVYDGNERSRQAGLRVMRIGAFFLIVFGALFEGIFFASQHPGFGQLIFPAALILLGLYLVLIRSHGRRGSAQPGPDSQDKPS
jgi:peptidoglycan/LPS O-acetylase OafA/YrhL